MRRCNPKIWPLVMLLLLALAGCDGGSVRGELVWDGAHVYEVGDTVQGQLVVLNGEVLVPEGAQVAGSVYILGGEVTIAGTIGEDVAIIAGDLVLDTTAVIAGDLSLGGGTVERAPSAVVLGQVLGESDIQINLETFFPQQTARQRLLRLLPQALMAAALAYLAARMLGGPVVRVSQTTRDHPVVAAAMGALLGIVGPTLLVLMAFTVLLIPVTLVALLLIGVVVIYAWIGLGTAVGIWMRDAFARDWSLPVSAMVGTFLFIALTDLLAFIPYVGSWIGILATLVGVGAVFLTRFGLREFVPSLDFGPPPGNPH